MGKQLKRSCIAIFMVAVAEMVIKFLVCFVLITMFDFYADANIGPVESIMVSIFFNNYRQLNETVDQEIRKSMSHKLIKKKPINQQIKKSIS